MDNAGAVPNVAQEARNKPFIFIILDRLKVVIEGHSEAAWLGSTGSGGFQPPVLTSQPEYLRNGMDTRRRCHGGRAALQGRVRDAATHGPTGPVAPLGLTPATSDRRLRGA